MLAQNSIEVGPSESKGIRSFVLDLHDFVRETCCDHFHFIWQGSVSLNWRKDLHSHPDQVNQVLDAGEGDVFGGNMQAVDPLDLDLHRCAIPRLEFLLAGKEQVGEEIECA